MTHTTPRLYLVALFALGLLGIACTLTGSPIVVTATPTSAPLTATQSVVTAEPTAVPPTATEPSATPTAQPADTLLPAALYFITAADGQLWRVAPDGVTVTQITHEAAPVTDYAISPADGSLVYFSANTFILSAADGSDRRVVFSGPTDYPEDLAINNQLTSPQWSPDGKRIAFRYGGIQILDLADPMLVPALLLPSDAVPDPNAGRPPATLRFYRQARWSPDGTHLLVAFSYYPEGGGWAILRLNSDGALVELPSPATGGDLCCAPTWSPDGQFIYFARPYVGTGLPGLWRVTASTGQLAALLTSSVEPGNEVYELAAFAQQLADGGLYFFHGRSEGFPNGAFSPLTMERGAPETGIGEPLRADTYLLDEALWAADGSGAVIMELTAEAVWPFTGPLLWLPANGLDAVPLEVEGSLLAWGR